MAARRGHRASWPCGLGRLHPLLARRTLRAGRAGRAGHGPAQHPRARQSVRDIPARARQAAGRAHRAASHAQAWLPRRPLACVPAAPDRALCARWLNIAEIELSALGRQCLARRIAHQDSLRRKVEQWEQQRNAAVTKVDWQFTTARPASSCDPSTHHFMPDAALAGDDIAADRLIEILKARRRLGDYSQSPIGATSETETSDY